MSVDLLTSRLIKLEADTQEYKDEVKALKGERDNLVLNDPKCDISYLSLKINEANAKVKEYEDRVERMVKDIDRAEREKNNFVEMKKNIKVKIVKGDYHNFFVASYDELRTVVIDNCILKKLAGFKRRQNGEVSFTYFEFYDDELDGVIHSIDFFPNNHCLTFKIPSKIVPTCASNWSELQINQLCIDFVDVFKIEDLIPNVNFVYQPSEELTEFVLNLDKLHYDAAVDEILDGHACVSQNLNKLDKKYYSLFKLLRSVNIRPSNKACVDLFVIFILLTLGFNDGPLEVIPQYVLPLKFETEDSIAKADFFILNVLTNLVLAVLEDKNKSFEDDPISSESQMIAEAIAAFQKFPSANFFIGIRVNGLKFFFYFIPRSEFLLNAMKTSTEANSRTRVNRFCCISDKHNRNGLDFNVRPIAEVVAHSLDFIRQLFLLP